MFHAEIGGACAGAKGVTFVPGYLSVSIIALAPEAISGRTDTRTGPCPHARAMEGAASRGGTARPIRRDRRHPADLPV